MPHHQSFFLGQRGPEPWSEDERLIRMLLRWLDTTCLLKGHELRPAARITDPEKWRKAMIAELRGGRSHASLAARDHVLRAIAQTESDLAAELPAAKEHLSTPNVKIAETA